jgi:hypothetical protein
MTPPNLDRHLAGWRGPLLAALVALIAGLPSLLLLPPLDRDESRYAQATSQMLESGDYVDIRFQDDPRWKKPVGIYWMQAAAVALTSKVENRDIAPYRIPSLLGAMLAAWACAWVGTALFGARAGFLAGAVLGATFLLSSEAGIAKTDAMLCGSVTLAMAGLARLYMASRVAPLVKGDPAQRPWKQMFWLGLGLSILIKGPIGLLVVVPAVVMVSLWDRQWAWLKRLGWGWGLPLLVLIVGPWAIAVTIATDGGFWREAIGGDLAPKIAGAQESHGGFPGMYLALSPLLLFPATLLWPAALSTGWSRRGFPGTGHPLPGLLAGPVLADLRDRPDQAVALHPAHLRSDRPVDGRGPDPADRPGLALGRRGPGGVRRRPGQRDHRLWPDRLRHLDGPDLGHDHRRLRRHGRPDRRLPAAEPGHGRRPGGRPGLRRPGPCRPGRHHPPAPPPVHRSPAGEDPGAERPAPAPGPDPRPGRHHHLP